MGVFVVDPTPVVGWSGLQLTLIGVAVVMLVISGWCAWVLYRRRNQHAASGSGSNDPTQPGGAVGTGGGEPAIASGSEPGVPQPQPSVARSPAEEAFFAPGDFPSRRCPECERTFPGVFDTCPFDSTALRPHESSGDSEAQRHLPRHYCPDCERRFELGASYCYHDGHTLHRDSDAASNGAATIRVCRDCGFETRDNLTACPRDDEPLITLDPMQRRRVKPVFPYNRCRSCGHVAPPDQTHCPTDGTLLLPELSAQLTALPPTGYGERRLVCPDCGTTYGPGCSHCSHDGTELIVLN